MEMSGAYQSLLTPNKVMNPEADGSLPIEVQTYNFIDPKLEDCWHHILGFITEPRDLESLIAASGFFSELIQPRKLYKLILPILMRNNYLTKDNVLPSRLVNKRFKSAVDLHLWLPTELACRNVEDMEVFTSEFPQCSSSTASVSLLHDFNVDLDIESEDDEAALNATLALLQKHGEFVRHLKLSSVIFDSRRLTLLQGVVQILSLVPNLDSLILDLAGLQVSENWQPLALPPLVKLSKLYLEEPAWNPDGHESLYPFMEHLVGSYGSQLTTLSCPGIDFGGGIPFQICKRKLSNLHEFEILLSSHDLDIGKQYKKLLLVNWPYLKKITLSGHIRVTYELFWSFCRYKETLEALEIEGELVWNEFTMQEFTRLKIDLGVFPKLTTLSIGTSDVGSDIWQLFKTQFVNLQHLRFCVDRLEGFQLREETPIPDAARRKILFEMFPKLSQFIWEKRVMRSESEDIVEIFYKEIVFRRPLMNVLAKKADN